MNRVLLQRCQKFGQAYINDAVFSKTWEENLQHLRAVLTALQQAGLTYFQASKMSIWSEGSEAPGSHNWRRATTS